MTLYASLDPSGIRESVAMVDDSAEMEKLVRKLRRAGKPDKILDAEGKIIPSKLSVARVDVEHPNASDADKFRLAQAQTLIDLATDTRTN
jgi:hypothetical protein